MTTAALWRFCCGSLHRGLLEHSAAVEGGTRGHCVSGRKGGGFKCSRDKLMRSRDVLRPSSMSCLQGCSPVLSICHGGESIITRLPVPVLPQDMVRNLQAQIRSYSKPPFPVFSEVLQGQPGQHCLLAVTLDPAHDVHFLKAGKQTRITGGCHPCRSWQIP